jgi:hypothetical protein
MIDETFEIAVRRDGGPTTMASVATTNSPQKRRKRGLPIYTAAILLLICCFLTLGITFLHGSMLDTLASQNANHLDALVSNLHQGRGPLPSDLRVASLSCERFGGPSPEIAQEMVYWQDITSDSKYKSPFLEPNVTRYMTFEPDGGGFNNVRMALETVLAIAHASGRTLVLVSTRDCRLASEAELFSSHILHIICRRPAAGTGNVLAL